MKLQQMIERHWYHKADPLLSILLFPLSLIYELVIKIRRLLFWLHLIPSTRLPVPVVIIGNLSVGGAGKTPLTKYLAQSLRARGINVGIILRGYKAKDRSARCVTANDDPVDVGDEALIYASNGLPVAIGSRRVDAGKCLLQAFPATQIILADDGMQHYYLARDLEICVIDSSRLLGNQQLLPLGPLREPLSRLKKVAAIVVNGRQNAAARDKLLQPLKVPCYLQDLQLQDFYNPHSQQSVSAEYFKLPAQQSVGHNGELNGAQNNESPAELMAIAGIGNPSRFFDFLEQQGLNLQHWQAFPDHYFYQASDINPKYAIITTEKDYTKLAQFNFPNIWVARVSAHFDDDQLLATLERLIRKEHS